MTAHLNMFNYEMGVNLIKRLINMASFYGGWLICMQEATGSNPLIGPLFVAALLTYHLAVTNTFKVDLILIIALALTGTLIDSLYIWFGFIVFKGGYACCPNLAPLWITSLWALYGSSVNHSMEWLKINFFLVAAPLGAMGAISSYLVGFELEAAIPMQPLSITLAIIGVVWALVVPLSLIFSRFLKKNFTNS